MFSINSVNANPWYSVENEIIQIEIEQLRLCGIDVPPISAFPLNIVVLKNALENIDQSNLNEDCLAIINSIKKDLNNKNFYTHKNIIGFQTQRPKIYFQDFGKRMVADSNLYLSSSKVGHNFAYNIALQVFGDDLRFDESYFSYYFNNHVLTLGRISRWWSPSFNSSLILSNSARPSPGISFSNYKPKSINTKYLSFLGPISYEFFLNRLESDRHIPNPLLFGNRVSINPNHRLKISLFRTAQFGGDGRKENLSIFFDMLRGKDNFDSSFASKEDEPGNQLGGLDFNLLLLNNKNLSLYGQIVGEDESGYLPSKTFYLIGAGYSWDLYKPKKLSIEYSDTGSRQINTTYNHSIYRNGYRYYGNPIGSAYGADSRQISINYNKTLRNNLHLNLKAIKGSLNYNNSTTFFIEDLSDDFTIIEMKFSQSLSQNLYLKLGLQYSDFLDIVSYDNLSSYASLEYKW